MNLLTCIYDLHVGGRVDYALGRRRTTIHRLFRPWYDRPKTTNINFLAVFHEWLLHPQWIISSVSDFASFLRMKKWGKTTLPIDTLDVIWICARARVNHVVLLCKQQMSTKYANDRWRLFISARRLLTKGLSEFSLFLRMKKSSFLPLRSLRVICYFGRKCPRACWAFLSLDELSFRCTIEPLNVCRLCN